MEDRKKKVLRGIDFKTEKGLEIGPLGSPLVKKSDGQVLYLDHADTETLKKKYFNDSLVNKDLIVHVDRVCSDGNLKAALSHDAPFDFVIASHVIEHIPDPLTWLNDIASLLNEGGKLRLIIPDCRFTFDFLRRTTAASDFIDNSARKLSCVSSMGIADSLFYSCLNPHPWGPDVKLRRDHDFEIVQHLIGKAIEGKEYIDAHNSVFDPSSFLRLMIDLCTEKLLPYICRYFFDTALQSIEFIVILEKSDAHDSERPENVDSRIQGYKQFLKQSPMRDGTFIRHRGALYIIDRGFKRYITIPQVLSRLGTHGYAFSEKLVKDVNDAEFDEVLMGTPLYRSVTYTDIKGVEHPFSGGVMRDRFQRSDFY